MFFIQWGGTRSVCQLNNMPFKDWPLPREFTQKNINNFRRQIKSLGLSYDWDREVNTSDPSYYKWTQWIFEQLYKKGLAYEAEVPVNWSPDLGTVVANRRNR